MRISNVNFHDVLDAVPDATIIVDEAGQIIFASTQVRCTFGYAPSELIGLPIERLLPKCFRVAHPAHREAFFTDPKPRPMGQGSKLYGLRKNGTEFPVEISLNAVRSGQESVRFETRRFGGREKIV